MLRSHLNAFLLGLLRLLGLLVLDAGVAAADPKPITLDEALAAVGRAPLVAVGTHEVAAASAQADAAGAWPNPSLRVAHNRLTAKLVAGANIPLPIFGTVGAARKQATAEAMVVRAENGITLRMLRHRVVLAWVSLARLDGEVIATSIAAQQAAELLLIAKGRKDAGVGADVDVTTVAAAKARADVAAAAALRAQSASSAELAGVLGWDPSQRLRSDGAPITGRVADIGPFRAQLARHPERTVAAARIAAADAAVEQINTLRWPSLTLEAEVSYDDPTLTDPNSPTNKQIGPDALIGLTVELPIFARIGDRARAARATLAAQRARLALTDAELGAGVAAAFERWQAAAETLAALERDVVPAQERAAALSAQAYREGARDLASALQAERDLAAVRAEVNAARADAAVAWEDLQLAAGSDAK